MKIKTITLSKEYKKGLPDFSNVTASASVTVELTDGERADMTKIWKAINDNIKKQLVAYENQG